MSVSYDHFRISPGAKIGAAVFCRAGGKELKKYSTQSMGFMRKSMCDAGLA
jgi:hypothetical protein